MITKSKYSNLEIEWLKPNPKNIKNNKQWLPETWKTNNFTAWSQNYRDERNSLSTWNYQNPRWWKNQNERVFDHAKSIWISETSTTVNKSQDTLRPHMAYLIIRNMLTHVARKIMKQNLPRPCSLHLAMVHASSKP